jgi:hypothetical protein
MEIRTRTLNEGNLIIGLRVAEQRNMNVRSDVQIKAENSSINTFKNIKVEVAGGSWCNCYPEDFSSNAPMLSCGRREIKGKSVGRQEKES